MANGFARLDLTVLFLAPKPCFNCFAETLSAKLLFFLLLPEGANGCFTLCFVAIPFNKECFRKEMSLKLTKYNAC